MPRAVLAPLLALAACGGGSVCAGCGDADPIEALPDSFRIEAHVDAVTGPGAEHCTPSLADAVWSLEFSAMHTDEPSFREVTPSANEDSAWHCAVAGGADCCDPLATDGDAATVHCVGHGVPRVVLVSFNFSFSSGGSGSGTSTRESIVAGSVLCVSSFSWPDIIAP